MDAVGFERTYADFENSIASRALKDVARHWRAICIDGRLPSWDDLRPSAIKAHLPIVWCYDYDPAADDFIGRLAGLEITALSTGPFKGTRLSALRPADKYPRSLIRAKRVVQEPALYRGHGVVYKTAERQGVGERIVMPLAAKRRNPAGIFGATAFKSVSAWAISNLVRDDENEMWFSLSGLEKAA